MFWSKKSTAQTDEVLDESFADGIEVWQDPPGANVDICFVHGLTGGRNSTWTAEGQAAPWPKLLLADKLTTARILTFGYDAYVLRASVASTNKLADHARNLLSDLTDCREASDAVSRPLIFVAHSLGGLVCKEAILQSRNNSALHLQGIFSSLAGIIFMGTPHQGSWMAKWAKIPAKGLGIIKSTNTKLLGVLETGDDFLESVQRRFLDMVQEQQKQHGRSVEIMCFYEELPITGVGTIVSQDSATFQSHPLLSIRATHSGIVKFKREEETGFKRVYAELRRWSSASRSVMHELDPRDASFLADLLVVDPQRVMESIETNREPVLKESSNWILKHPAFERWRNDSQHGLLWIRGDPGKGKTMLLCSIIQFLQRTSPGAALAFCFCQETNPKLSSAASVLRGLSYMLLNKRPFLISRVRRRFGHLTKKFNEDEDAVMHLGSILGCILEHLGGERVYLATDALDECTKNQRELVGLIESATSKSHHVRWVVSSRYGVREERRMPSSKDEAFLCLELNHKSISAAVSSYVDHKVGELADRMGYDGDRRERVRKSLLQNANDTFLWVSLACKRLRDPVSPMEPEHLPPGLPALYSKMLSELELREDSRVFLSILQLTLTVCRPISLVELASLNDEPVLRSRSLEELRGIVRQCGSFLSIGGTTVSFIHHSAKEFLAKAQIGTIHEIVLQRSLLLMTQTLKHNMYGLPHPSASLAEAPLREPDPLASVRYSCEFWIDHACDLVRDDGPDVEEMELAQNVLEFLETRLLYWMESLCIVGCYAKGMAAMQRLVHAAGIVADRTSWFERHWILRLLQKGGWSLPAAIQRFMVSCRPIADTAPLQIYGTALVLCPSREIRDLYEKQRFPFIRCGAQGIAESYNRCTHVLDGHTDTVVAAAFSNDETMLVSASKDNTVRIWNIRTGNLCQQFTGYSGIPGAVALSPEGDLVAYSSEMDALHIWRTEDGSVAHTFETGSGLFSALRFSPDGKSLATGTSNGLVTVWDLGSGAQVAMQGGQAPPADAGVHFLAFSPDGCTIAASSTEGRVWVSTVATGERRSRTRCLGSAELSFSDNGTILTVYSRQTCVQHWDIARESWRKGRIPLSHGTSSDASTFSPQSGTVAVIVSSRGRSNILFWLEDDSYRASVATAAGFIGTTTYMGYSPSGNLLVTCSDDWSVRLWDTNHQRLQEDKLDKGQSIQSVVLSPDGNTLFSTTLRECHRWSKDLGSSSWVQNADTVAVSPDSKKIAYVRHGYPHYQSTAWLFLQDSMARDLEYPTDGPDQMKQVIFLNDDTAAVADGHTMKVDVWTFSMWRSVYQRSVEMTEAEYPFDYLPHEGISVPEDGLADDSPPRLLTRNGQVVAMDWGHLLPREQRAAGQAGRDKGVVVRDDWIMAGGRRVLWLPPEYWPTCTTMQGDRLIIGQDCGRVTELRLDLFRLPC